MDLLNRLHGLVDSLRKLPEDTAGHDPGSRGGPVRLTLWGRRFRLQLEIPPLGKADDAEHVPEATEEIGRLRDETGAEPSSPPQIPAEALGSSVIGHSEPQQRPAAPLDSRWQYSAISFWDVLDPTEREALRSLASWRTFAAGARLMQEGERADHVIVILGGRTKICVNENGRERVLAVRGLGQLVGERAALEVSVRSATVIALEMVWALVVQTKDFAAFISAHPRVLSIVQNQLYDRLTEEPIVDGHHHGAADSFGAGPATARSGHGPVTEPSRRHPRPLNGENCTVFLSDVVGFGARARNDKDRRIIREALFSMTRAALAGIPDVWSEDRGDGLLTIVPPSVPPADAIDHLLRELPAAIERHNSDQHDSARFQLRFAVNVGPVVSDIMGVSGEAIIVAARLVEAPSFKDAIAASMASFGVIASPFVYETVIRHSADSIELASYSQVPVEVKESETTAWMRLFDAQGCSFLVPHSTFRAPYRSQLASIRIGSGSLSVLNRWSMTPWPFSGEAIIGIARLTALGRRSESSLAPSLC